MYPLFERWAKQHIDVLLKESEQCQLSRQFSPTKRGKRKIASLWK